MKEQFRSLPLQLLLDKGTSAQGRAVNAKWIDPCLLKRWQSTCVREHGELCHLSPHAGFAQLWPEFLVDVWQQCLVAALPSHEYICLSYVWGGSAQFNTLSSNIDKLRQPGAFAPVNMAQRLPNTIRHAMAVVEMLKGRYLWVDSLCIVQDNADKKHQEIGKMGAIYANAMLTIIAEGGSNADSGILGLRGVSPNRTFDQRIWSLGRGTKVVEMPEVAENSIWGERGWTFQEETFSKRRLVFSKDSVRWKCQCAQWREDVKPADTSTALKGFNGAPAPIEIQLRNATVECSLLMSLVEKYNTRKLTFPEDSLNAFAGITTALRPPFNHPFVSGLPIEMFHVALLWQPSDQPLTPRTAKNAAAKSCLPSWSWASWQGKLDLGTWRAGCSYDMSIDDEFWESIQPIVTWRYHLALDDSGVIVPSVLFNSERRFLNSKTAKCSDGWTRYPVRLDEVSQLSKVKSIEEGGVWTRQRLTHEELKEHVQPKSAWMYQNYRVPGKCFWYPIPLSLPDTTSPKQNQIIAPWISCRTRRAFLVAGGRLPPNERNLGTQGPSVSLDDAEGHNVGIMIPNRQDEIGGLQGKLVELVEVARGRKTYRDFGWGMPFFQEEHSLEMVSPEAGRYEYYYVLWVEWENDVAYRRGLGRVIKSVWESQAKEKIRLLLG